MNVKIRKKEKYVAKDEKDREDEMTTDDPAVMFMPYLFSKEE